MSEVARAASVGRATLHRHFHGKGDLLRAISTRCIAETNAAMLASDAPEGPAVDRLESLLRSVIPLGDRYAFLRFEGLQDEDLKVGHETQLEWVRSLIGHLKAECAIAADLPTSWAVELVDQVIFAAWAAVSRGELSTDEAAELALRTLLKGWGSSGCPRRRACPGTRDA